MDRSRRPTKGQRTRQRIVERAAVLFNTRGVAGASMADVSEATGLEKGGVYNHFATKEELALEAFEYGARLVRTRVDAALESEPGAVAKLRAFFALYRSSRRPFIEGGCPLMNTAIEADDTNPELRRRALAALESWRATIARTLDEGVRAGELRPHDTAAFATTIVAAIEGGVMFSLVARDSKHLRAALDHLEAHLDALARP